MPLAVAAWSLSHWTAREVSTSLKKFKRTEFIQNIFSDYNGMKLETKNKKEFGTPTNKWKLNNTVLN